MHKIGPGTLTLYNQNTYTGGTVIDDGTLLVGIGNALPTSGDITVETATAVLDLGGYGLQTSGTLHVSGGGTVLDSSGGGSISAAAIECAVGYHQCGHHRGDAIGEK